MADMKDTGVTVADKDVINEILPFCAQGVEGRDMLSQEAFTADVQRTIGHQPGIARQELANKQARQTSHIAAGLAQFLARRYAPGVKDDGDLDRIESALVSVILDLLAARLHMDPIGGIRFFEDEMPRPGYVECNAGVVSNFAATYPQMAAYLETPWGQTRLVSSLAAYETLHTAVWHTNADGTKVGWNGIGGVAKFYWDKTADTLKMPDLQDMFQGAAGPSLGVGGAQGDQGRDAFGTFQTVTSAPETGVFSRTSTQPAIVSGASSSFHHINTTFSLTRVQPVGPAFAPKRWGALACAYLGQPAL